MERQPALQQSRQLFPDIALTAAGGVGVLSKSGTLAHLSDHLADLAERTRTLNWADDTGAIDFEAFLRRDPVPLGDGTVLRPLSPAEEAAALARYEDLPLSKVRSQGAQADYQTGIYGANERRIDLPGGGQAYPDGFTPQYGAIGDAKLVTSDRSWYVPESLGRPGLTVAAVADMDFCLRRMASAADTLGGNGVIEITTNSPAAAAFIESRMEHLGLRGYVRTMEG